MPLEGNRLPPRVMAGPIKEKARRVVRTLRAFRSRRLWVRPRRQPPRAAPGCHRDLALGLGARQFQFRDRREVAVECLLLLPVVEGQAVDIVREGPSSISTAASKPKHEYSNVYYMSISIQTNYQELPTIFFSNNLLLLSFGNIARYVVSNPEICRFGYSLNLKRLAEPSRQFSH